jgi:beta-lactamase superfamily II metal-dependent hydrolase
MVRRPVRPDAGSLVIHLLNMGRTKFGDCLVVQSAGKTILIDAGHPGDDKEREDRPSIPTQLGTILSQQPPYHFDLLIVTHCHLDHIGCLPKLIANNIVTCDRALVADEKLGFGLDVEGEGDARLSKIGPKVRNLVAALSEEDHSNLRGDELEEFLSDAATLQDNYTNMLRTLGRNVDVVRYRQGTASERNAVARLVAEMADTGLKIFGPTADQLVHCAETIQRVSGDAADMVADMGDPSESLAEAYRRVMASSDDGADAIQHAVGWAKNCQSIVLSFGQPGERALLPGDMQFAEPGIREIEDLVRQLRSDVAADAPYVFAKMPHHTSHNGINEEILGEWQWPPLLGHSGGYNDPTHPDPATLGRLKGFARQHEFTYARTDHNGRLTVEPTRQEINGERGRLNDFTPNSARDELVEKPPEKPPEVTSSTAETAAGVALPSSDHYIDVTFMRIPYIDGRISIDGRVVEIARGSGGEKSRTGQAGGGLGKSTESLVVEKTTEMKAVDRPSDRGNQLAPGRTLPSLLFVTDPARLKENVGEDADRALDMIRKAGHRIVTGTGPALAEATRIVLRDSKAAGVVLLGGYDVVPSQRVDVLGPDLRARMPAGLIARDRDGFVVWSDDIYGDREPDGVPELPVSRIPDARVGSFFLSMLTSSGAARPGKFGLRNRERPFAEAIYAAMSGNGSIQTSGPTGIAASQRELAACQNIYFMLHGDYRDSTTYWGEDDAGNTPAIDISSLPASGVGLAFAGCCWGALTVSEPAIIAGERPTPRMVERSIALSILKAGAKAFVGATGVHYSPGEEGGFFGGPLHAAFWDEIRRRNSPALALFNARHAYLLEIPHGRNALWNFAVERKLYKQFTCLGLGW